MKCTSLAVKNTPCENDASWLPVVQFYAPKIYGDKFFSVEVGLPVCAECKEHIRLEDVNSPQLREVADRVIASRNLVLPDHTRSKLDWEPLEESLLKEHWNKKNN